jgi:hypothetical protein
MKIHCSVRGRSSQVMTFKRVLATRAYDAPYDSHHYHPGPNLHEFRLCIVFNPILQSLFPKFADANQRLCAKWN